MNLKATGQPLTLCLMTLALGAASITIADSALAQPSSGQLSAGIMRSLQIAQASSLTGNWRLANMTEADLPMPMLPVGDLTADFSGGSISGSGGCNRFKGSYTTKGNQLSIGPLASTFKACEEPIMTQEFKYLKALQAAQRYEVTEQGLQIFYKTEQGSGVLRFSPQAVRALW